MTTCKIIQELLLEILYKKKIPKNNFATTNQNFSYCIIWKEHWAGIILDKGEEVDDCQNHWHGHEKHQNQSSIQLLAHDCSCLS